MPQLLRIWYSGLSGQEQKVDGLGGDHETDGEQRAHLEVIPGAPRIEDYSHTIQIIRNYLKKSIKITTSGYLNVIHNVYSYHMLHTQQLFYVSFDRARYGNSSAIFAFSGCLFGKYSILAKYSTHSSLYFESPKSSNSRREQFTG